MGWLALGLAVLAAVCYSAAAVWQESEATALAGPTQASARLLLGLVRRPRWLLGVAATVVGAGVHVVALGTGPLTLVQPVGALTLVVAVPWGARLAHRRTTGREWAGAALVTLSLGGLLSVAPLQAAHPELTGSQAAALVVTGAVVVGGLAAGARRCSRAGVRAVLLAAAAGIAFGLTAALIRVLAVQLPGQPAVLASPLAGAVLVFAVGGLLLCQSAYRSGGLGAPLATQTMADPVVASLVGVLVLGESVRGGVTGAVIALLSAVTGAAGLALLTRTPGRQSPRAQSADPGAAAPSTTENPIANSKS